MDLPTRLGIFGGTFDPPHVGHLILAEIALSSLELDRLLWVLTPDPPHKQGRLISPLPQRLELLHAALAGDERFELSRIDINRPPPHYALDTVRLLRENHPDAQLIYLMGSDSLRDLPTWRQPQEFVLACDEIGVMRRPGAVFDLARLEEQLPGLGQRVRFVEAPLIEIAASDIRRRAAAGLPYRYFLPEKVYQLIQSNGLYTARASGTQ
jgi:nicotinate-nucleotide adenylyltransferase